MKGLRLNVGCGSLRRRNELGIDRYLTSAVDVQADILALPFPDNSAEVVRMDQLLEHFPQKSAVRVLLEVKRVLRSGGRLTLSVPDMTAICEAYPQAKTLRDKLLWMCSVYGRQTHEGEHHKSGWDMETLRDLLQAIGFERINTRRCNQALVDVSIRAMVVKQ